MGSPARTLAAMKRMALIALTAVGLGVAGFAAAGSARAQREPWRHPPVVVASAPMLAGVVVSAPAVAKRRTRFARAKDGEAVPVEITAYCLSGTTRRGRWVRQGIVATDPRVFPLSRYLELFVGDRYLGRFLIDDTGLLIKGPKIDLWVSTCAEAIRFGRVKGTAVLVPRGQ